MSNPLGVVESGKSALLNTQISFDPRSYAKIAFITAICDNCVHNYVRSGRSCHRYHAVLCYLPHAEKENSVKNLRCLAANIFLEKRLQELTSMKNLELESHRQFVVFINLVLATPATSMAPDCTGPAVPSRPVIVLLTGQELVLHVPLPWPVPWRGHFSFASQRRTNTESCSYRL